MNTSDSSVSLKISAPPEELQNRYLTFKSEEKIYGIDLAHVVEIIGVLPFTKVPLLPDYFKGIVNLRGKVVPVVDVRIKLGRAPQEKYDEKTCILVVDIKDMCVGLIVDSVSEVLTLPGDICHAPPSGGRLGEENILKSVAEHGGNVIMNLDCIKFFALELSENKVGDRVSV